MTEKEYKAFRKTGMKIYEIFISKGRVVHREVPFDEFDKKWIKRDWLNKSIIYNTERKDDFMYVTEDKLKEMKEYLVNYFINLEHKKIREAQAKINRLSKVKY